MKNPDHWALVVAVEKYKYFEPLRSPGDDAANFIRWLLNEGGVPQKQIISIDSAGEQGAPKTEQIFDAFRRMGAMLGHRRGERLYFYYAGHGLGPEFNDVAIVPADAQGGALEGVCLGINSCISFLTRTGLFDEVVVFMDCCRDTVEVAPRVLPFSARQAFNGSRIPVNHFALFAASDGGKSFELREEPDGSFNPAGIEEHVFRGLMTSALLTGLRGDPRAFEGNRVTATSLAKFVQARVADGAKDKSLQQRVQPPSPPSQQEIVFLQREQSPSITVRFTVASRSAHLPVMIQNVGDLTKMETKPAGAPGEVVEFTIESGARYQVIVPGVMQATFDTAELGSDGHVSLP